MAASGAKRSFARRQSVRASLSMFMAHHSERSAVPILLEQNTDVRVSTCLLGHSKLDTTELYTRVATFSLETKAGEAGAGVITWTAKPAQKHDPSNVRWIKDLSCRSE